MVSGWWMSRKVIKLWAGMDVSHVGDVKQLVFCSYPSNSSRRAHRHLFQYKKPCSEARDALKVAVDPHGTRRSWRDPSRLRIHCLKWCSFSMKR